MNLNICHFMKLFSIFSPPEFILQYFQSNTSMHILSHILEAVRSMLGKMLVHSLYFRLNIEKLQNYHRSCNKLYTESHVPITWVFICIAMELIESFFRNSTCGLLRLRGTLL